MNKYLEAEKRLAELLGWTNLLFDDGIFPGTFGTPPDWVDLGLNVGQRCSMPKWCRNWNACGPLMVEHELRPLWTDTSVMVEDKQGQTLSVALYCDHFDKESATVFALVQAVIRKLENNNESQDL